VPAPKVTSTVVRLEPLAEPGSDDLTMVSHITRLAFGQRRKMLRRSLANLHPHLSDFLREIDVREEDRAEQVRPDQFALLAKLVRQNPH
jgi:Dimethyladenosine transferase (rRNA methylation)